MRDKRNAYRIFVGKPEGKRPLGKSSLRGRIILLRVWSVDVDGVWIGNRIY
jgi:hypothetical protein